MQALFSEIQSYRELIADLREELSENYFSNKQLLKQVERSQSQIQKMILTLESARVQNQLREHVLANKNSAHPDRKPILAHIPTKPTSHGLMGSQEQVAISSLISQNCSLELSLKPLRLHPAYFTNVNGRRSLHLIPECRLKLWLYHIDKKAESAYFSFSSQHSPNIYKNAETNTKLDRIQIIHKVTSSNITLMKELVQEQIYIFLENQFKLIVAMCVLSPAQIFNHNDRSANSTTRMLSFNMIGTETEMFVLEAHMSLREQIISPELVDLVDKMHAKKVIINQHSRSRSPSPTLHRRTANSVLQKTKTKRITIMNNRPITIRLHSLANKEEEIDRSISITFSQNITTPSIQASKEGDELVVKMVVRLQNDEEDGYLVYRLSGYMLKVSVKEMKVLTFMSLERSRIVFKTEADCQKVNAIIALTENVYIRPNIALRIQQSPIEQKVLKNSIISSLCKTDHDPQLFQVYPALLKEVIKGERGVNILYSINCEWLEDRKEVKIVIAAKSKTRLIKNSNILESVVESYMGRGKEKQQYYEYYIEVYVIKHRIQPQPDPEVSLCLEVGELGIYTLDMSSILMKNSRYLVESTNSNVLYVIDQEFGKEEWGEQIQVQVLQPITIKEEVVLMVHDLTRMVMTPIRVQLNQKEYWSRAW